MLVTVCQVDALLLVSLAIKLLFSCCLQNLWAWPPQMKPSQVIARVVMQDRHENCCRKGAVSVR